MTTPTITGTASSYARGVNKTIAIMGEASYGVAPAAGSVPGQLLRRNTAAFNLTTQLIQSQEIFPSQQVRDARQGPRAVQGTFSGNLSPASFSLFWEALLRNNFTAGVSVGPLTDTTGTLSGSGLTIASTGTNFETAGFVQGDVVRLTGLTGAALANNAQNRRILGLPTANSLLLSTMPSDVAWATGQSVTIGVAGKKLLMPTTGQIVPSFTLEEWQSDIGQSRLSTGLRLTQASFNIPASGFASFSASFTGQNQVVSTTQAYPAAAAVLETTALTAVGGLVFYKGQPVLYINTLSLQVSSATQADPVVGSNLAPDVFLGRLSAQGSFSCLSLNDSMQADYLNEVVVDLSILMTTSESSGSDFFSIYMPSVKLSSGTITDSDRNITRSYNFMALENTTNPLANDTTLVIQDSMA